jgi:hypothetical protein
MSVILVGMSSAKSVMSGRIWRARDIGWKRCVRRSLSSRKVEGTEFGGEIGARLIIGVIILGCEQVIMA